MKSLEQVLTWFLKSIWIFLFESEGIYFILKGKEMSKHILSEDQKYVQFND